MFIQPSDVRPTRPPGAYIVGLGPTIELGRNELKYAVRQALVDRCLRLYDESPSAGGEEPGGVIQVGVSTILLGVRNDEALRIEDSVVGIVEGVLAANEMLVRYEGTRPPTVRPVHVVALEFVERYADRADLAAAAVRALPTATKLGDDDAVRNVTVQTRRRRAATERQPDRAVADLATVPHHGFCPTILGSVGTACPGRRPHDAVRRVAARWRRCAEGVQHRLDRQIVDALVNPSGHRPYELEGGADAPRPTRAELAAQPVPDHVRRSTSSSTPRRRTIPGSS